MIGRIISWWRGLSSPTWTVDECMNALTAAAVIKRDQGVNMESAIKIAVWNLQLHGWSNNKIERAAREIDAKTKRGITC